MIVDMCMGARMCMGASMCMFMSVGRGAQCMRMNVVHDACAWCKWTSYVVLPRMSTSLKQSGIGTATVASVTDATNPSRVSSATEMQPRVRPPKRRMSSSGAHLFSLPASVITSRSPSLYRLPVAPIIARVSIRAYAFQ